MTDRADAYPDAMAFADLIVADTEEELQDALAEIQRRLDDQRAVDGHYRGGPKTRSERFSEYLRERGGTGASGGAGLD